MHGFHLAKHALVALLLLFLSSPGAQAQQFPSQQRGTTADTGYQLGEIDNINLFNGQLSMNIPLGGTYRVGPSFSYGLNLTYNSNGWDYEEQTCVINGGQSVAYDLPIPEPRRVNAGFGWRLNLGTLEAPASGGNPEEGPTYHTPDGGQHAFYTTLHPGLPAAGSQPDTWFTQDGTYLRQQHFTAGDQICKSGSSFVESHTKARVPATPATKTRTYAGPTKGKSSTTTGTVSMR